MIQRCSRRWLEAKCKQSGIEDFHSLIVQDMGDVVMAETAPLAVKPSHPAKRSEPALPQSGPGTELKALLAKFGIHASPTCGCNRMAKQMDAWGQESLHHIEEIVDVMEETARKRKLPFLRTAGRILVRQACRIAKKKGNGK